MFSKSRLHLERWQGLIYFISVIAAFCVASLFKPKVSFEQVINPALAFMLFVTFLQVPLRALGSVFKDWRFLSVLLFGNFIVIPALVYGLSCFFELDFLIKLGVFMVLLSPCIDYVVTFTHMGKGAFHSLLAATPLLLLLQMLFLPLYLSLFLGENAASYIEFTPFIDAFLWLIILPLGLAGLVQFWAAKRRFGQRIKQGFDILPVPATALVLCIIIFFITPQIGLARHAVITVLPLYIAFAILAPLLGFIIAWLWRLNKPQKRTIAFSMATRNSLVVMPLALTNPEAIPVLPAIIVTQTLIELISELVYIEIIKRI